MCRKMLLEQKDIRGVGTMSRVLLFSAISGLATAVGGIIAVLFCCQQRRVISLFLGFAAGVMLALSFFDLIPHGVEMSGWWGAIGGIVGGAVLIALIDKLLPHLHKSATVDSSTEYIKLGYFIAVGIALHNLPEGLAIGAGFEAAPELGGAIALAIALHNVPEGLSLSVPLQAGGLKALKIVGVCLLAGIFTPLGTLIGSLFYGISPWFVGFCLALAGGAMLYIVFDELIPESQHQSGLHANVGLAAGMLLALVAL